MGESLGNRFHFFLFDCVIRLLCCTLVQLLSPLASRFEASDDLLVYEVLFGFPGADVLRIPFPLDQVFKAIFVEKRVLLA